jgi:hypothetical protein
MPVNDHLSWFEVTNFAPGLWTNSTQDMPATAAQQMDDCYPYPGGGLRAFFASTAQMLTNSGISSAKVCRGFYVHHNQINVFNSGVGSDQVTFDANYAVMTSNPTSFPFVDSGFIFYDFRNALFFTAPDTTWQSRKVFLDAVAPNGGTTYQSQFTGYEQAAGPNDYVVFTANTPGAGEAGAYRHTFGSAPTLLFGSGAQCCMHQSRLVVASSGAVRFTDAGGLVLTGTITPAPGLPGQGIAWLAPISPSDLLVGTLGGSIYNIQGDLADPTVRSLGQLQSSSGAYNPIFTPNGLVVVAPHDGAYFMDGSGGTTKFTRQIDSENWVPRQDGYSLGQPAFLNGYLFLQGGLVYDLATSAFFRIAAMQNCVYYDADRTNRTTGQRVIGVTSGAAFTFPGVTFGSARATNFTWKSAPLHDPSGRQVQIREVQLIVRSYEAGAQLTVTVNGTARTVTLGSAGRANPRFLFSESAQQLDVTVRSVGGAGSTEAPTIESVRVGSRSRHLIT